MPVSGDAWKVETVEGHSSCSPTDFCSVSVTSSLRWARPVEWSDKVSADSSISNIFLRIFHSLTSFVSSNNDDKYYRATTRALPPMALLNPPQPGHWLESLMEP